MINKIDKNEDRKKDLSKMKSLLDILTDPSKRCPLKTLQKCEIALEKLKNDMAVVSGVSGTSREVRDYLIASQKMSERSLHGQGQTGLGSRPNLGILPTRLLSGPAAVESGNTEVTF